MMTRNNFALDSRTDTSVTFARHEGASCALSCVLALFFILPAILYLLLASKTLRTTCVVYEEETGCRIVIGGDDPIAKDTLRQWAKGLPQAGEEIIGEEALELPEASPSEIDVPRQIRALADLRDSGLLTQDEFEDKKQDLLGRM